MFISFVQHYLDRRELRALGSVSGWRGNFPTCLIGHELGNALNELRGWPRESTEKAAWMD